MLSPDEAFRRSVDADRKKLLDRIAAATAGERPDTDIVDALEADLLRVERGELALYVSEVRLLQTARDADGPLHEHSARLRDIAIDATSREQAWRVLSGRLSAMQAELQVGENGQAELRVGGEGHSSRVACARAMLPVSRSTPRRSAVHCTGYAAPPPCSPTADRRSERR